MSHFSKNLRRRRQTLGMSTEELARLIPIGATKSTINRWELGEHEPRLSDVEHLARALHTTPAALVGWTEASSDPNPGTTHTEPATTKGATPMMYSEFTERTGFHPTQSHYHAIEEAYIASGLDKDAFCAAYKENQDGLAGRIASETDLHAFRETCAETRRIRIERDQNARKIDRLEQRINELESRLERELEWQPRELETAMSQEDYEKLVGDSTVKHLTTEEAMDMIASEFGFDRSKVSIIRQLHRMEINRHHSTRIVGTVQRDPLFDAWDWNYIAFSVNGNHYEMVNGELHLR